MPYSWCNQKRKYSTQVHFPDHWNQSLVRKGVTGHRMILEMAFHAFLYVPNTRCNLICLQCRVLARNNTIVLYCHRFTELSGSSCLYQWWSYGLTFSAFTLPQQLCSAPFRCWWVHFCIQHSATPDLHSLESASHLACPLSLELNSWTFQDKLKKQRPSSIKNKTSQICWHPGSGSICCLTLLWYDSYCCLVKLSLRDFHLRRLSGAREMIYRLSLYVYLKYDYLMPEDWEGGRQRDGRREEEREKLKFYWKWVFKARL